MLLIWFLDQTFLDSSMDMHLGFYMQAINQNAGLLFSNQSCDIQAIVVYIPATRWTIHTSVLLER